MTWLALMIIVTVVSLGNALSSRRDVKKALAAAEEPNRDRLEMREALFTIVDELDEEHRGQGVARRAGSAGPEGHDDHAVWEDVQSIALEHEGG